MRGEGGKSGLGVCFDTDNIGNLRLQEPEQRLRHEVASEPAGRDEPRREADTCQERQKEGPPALCGCPSKGDAAM